MSANRRPDVAPRKDPLPMFPPEIGRPEKPRPPTGAYPSQILGIIALGPPFPKFFGIKNRVPSLGRVLHKSAFCKRGSVNVRFAPKAAEVLRCRELTRMGWTGRAPAPNDIFAEREVMEYWIGDSRVSPP